MKKIFCILSLVISAYAYAQEINNQDTVSTRRSLVEMCQEYPTDKCPDIHNFVEIYDRYFDPIRDSVKRLFEIGILHGVSHLMWDEYFTRAEIYGIDIKDYSDMPNKRNVHTFVADQSKREDLQAFIDTMGSEFDIIIDDGGHAMDQQQISMGFLFKHLQPGGYYIIEDVHTSLKKYYDDPYFKVNETGSNTTLFMIEWFIKTGFWRSEYMTDDEMKYIVNNIEFVDLNYRTTEKHSIVCIIKKKDTEVTLEDMKSMEK